MNDEHVYRTTIDVAYIAADLGVSRKIATRIAQELGGYQATSKGKYLVSAPRYRAFKTEHGF